MRLTSSVIFLVSGFRACLLQISLCALWLLASVGEGLVGMCREDAGLASSQFALHQFVSPQNAAMAEVLCASVLLTVLWAAYRLRVRAFEQREARLERLVAERTNELRSVNEVLEQSRVELAVMKEIVQERKRISQDIHDDVGAHLTNIALWSELARREIKRLYDDGSSATLPSAVSAAALSAAPPAKRHFAPEVYIAKIAAASQTVVQNLGSIIWALNPQNDSLDMLFAYLREHITSFVEGTELHCVQRYPTFYVPRLLDDAGADANTEANANANTNAHDDSVSPVADFITADFITADFITADFIASDLAFIAEMRFAPTLLRSIYLVVKEAVNNVVKHAHATELVVEAMLKAQPADHATIPAGDSVVALVFSIRDNGVGLGGAEQERMLAGNGLRNMRQRVEAVGGTLSINNNNNVEGAQGTAVMVSVPLHSFHFHRFDESF